jgi:hypothetical protein
MLTWGVTNLPYEYRNTEQGLLFVSFIIPYWLVWDKAILSATSKESDSSFWVRLATLWGLVLGTIGIAWLLLELVLLMFSGPSAGFNF